MKFLEVAGMDLGRKNCTIPGGNWQQVVRSFEKKLRNF